MYQTLKALANVLHGYEQDAVTKADYLKLLTAFAKTHRKNGKPYLAEACHPDTGSFEGHDGYNHSEHYFHSRFNDLVITGLVGLTPRDDDTLEVKPLAPATWDYYALDNVPYRGHLVSILWDRDGTRYKRGKGMRVFANGNEIAAAEKLAPLTVKLPAAPRLAARGAAAPVNFAVNNDGTYYPRVLASYSNPKTSPSKLIDGNSWYHRDPPNRWTCEGTSGNTDWVTIDFGTKRAIHTAKLYFLDDGSGVTPPYTFDLEHCDGKQWVAIPGQTRNLKPPTGHRANVAPFPAIKVTTVRAVFSHSRAGRTGLTEIELWGNAKLPLAEPPHPAGNLAYNPGDKPFPKASASHADRFGGGRC